MFRVHDKPSPPDVSLQLRFKDRLIVFTVSPSAELQVSSTVSLQEAFDRLMPVSSGIIDQLSVLPGKEEPIKVQTSFAVVS